MFTDEAIYIRWAQIMKNDATLRFLPLTDGKQPLFMWMIIPFFKIFEDPLVSGRMVSVLSGVGSVTGLFFLSFELFKSKKIALLSSMFYGISPYVIFFNRMALVDSMLSMFGIWALFFAVKTAKFLRLDYALLTGFCLGTALLTKSPGIFFILLLPTTLFFLKSTRKVVFSFCKLICLWLVSVIVSVSMYGILKLGPGFEMVTLRSREYLFSFSDIIKDPLHPIILNIGRLVEWMVYFVPIVFIILALFAFFFKKKNYRWEIAVLGLWFVIPIFIELEIAKIFTARYILFTLFPIFILSAFVVLRFLEISRKIFLPLTIFFCASLLFLDYLIINDPEHAILPRDERAGYLEAWTAGVGVREAAMYIREEHLANPEKHIVVGSEGSFGVLPNGLEMYIEDLPNVSVVGHSTPDIDSIKDSLIGAKKAQDKVYLVINDSRFWADPEKVGAVVLKSWEKAQKPDGTRDRLLLMEVTNKAIDVYNENHIPQVKK